jgi:hypothetical protein
MYQSNFYDLMQDMECIDASHDKELFLLKARADYQQNVFFAENDLRQIDAKINFIRQERELLGVFPLQSDEFHTKKSNLKISICIILELLNMAGKGKSFNELTKISALIALVTGFSQSYVLNTAQKGFTLSGDYHGDMIEEVNKVLVDLRLPFALNTYTAY